MSRRQVDFLVQSLDKLSVFPVQGRFKDVVRYLHHLGVEVSADTIRRTNGILEGLICDGDFPTGQLAKYWLEDATVTSIFTAVWTVFANDSSSTGMRSTGIGSIANLMSINTLILLLDQCGGRITTLVDKSDRHVG